MDISFDFTPLVYFFNQPVEVAMWQIFWTIGWIPIAIAFLWGVSQVWLSYIRGQWASQWKYILLAIDIPRGNEQSPKAVENLFTYLSGMHGSINFKDKWWEGKMQFVSSCEIVSIEGYTQFLVRAPSQFRDLVESGIYSQYPDAEITEVDDYTKDAPKKFPDDEYDIWGTEYIQAAPAALPIKLYKEFFYQNNPKEEATFKDPMASLMDLCSSLKKGEQLWFQLVIIPFFDWGKEGDLLVSKILGEKVEAKKNFFFQMISSLGGFAGEIFGTMFGLEMGKAEEKKEDAFRMFNLKPKEKKQIEAIQAKVDKLGFEFKVRFIYLAKKDVMDRSKVVGGFFGWIKQFVSMDLNNLRYDKEKTATRADYFFVDYRTNIKKNRMIRNYIAREDWAGRKPGKLNIEELATLWHFPLENAVKAPLVQKAPGRKAEPPMRLPVAEERAPAEDIFSNQNEGEGEKEKKFSPPDNLPVV